MLRRYVMLKKIVLVAAYVTGCYALGRRIGYAISNKWGE